MIPILLDMFCGAGGACAGYQAAGFEVWGVDINPQPNYPGERFIQADAIQFAMENWKRFNAIHASPPCQAHTTLAAVWRGKSDYDDRHLDWLPITRDILKSTGLPYIIENVPGAARSMENPIMLCGKSFGLRVYRHRHFESNILLLAPPHETHDRTDPVPNVGRGANRAGYMTITGHGGFGGGITLDYARAAMGCEWMGRKELSQAIPPAYTRHLGQFLIRAV